jgi:hypothetical protein
MNKRQILDEIVRTAQKNGGRPLGVKRFQDETGIKQSDWYGKYWIRWGDAVKEAGCEPNKLQDSYEEEWLIEQLILLIREIGHFPVYGEFRLKAQADKTFPSHTTFGKLGNKEERIKRVLNYCRTKNGYDDVISLCNTVLQTEFRDKREKDEKDEFEIGYVYLIKSGRYYKIGRSNSVGRRGYELSIKLPEKVTTEHIISTDDPVGIEAYWHKRFKDKRKNGEWFDITAGDVKAFKRRRFM